MKLGQLQRAARAGFEYHSPQAGIWNLGIAWAEPLTGNHNELLSEGSSRIDVLAALKLMFNLQYIRHSALPGRDDNSLAGICHNAFGITPVFPSFSASWHYTDSCRQQRCIE